MIYFLLISLALIVIGLNVRREIQRGKDRKAFKKRIEELWKKL